MQYKFAFGADDMDDFVPYSHNPRTIYAHVMVLNKGDFVGISRVYKSGEIADVFSMPDYRGRGIGKRMLQRLLSRIHNNMKLWLYTTADNPVAISLYRGLGMHEYNMNMDAAIKRKNKWLRGKTLVYFIANSR